MAVDSFMLSIENNWTELSDFIWTFMNLKFILTQTLFKVETTSINILISSIALML